MKKTGKCASMKCEQGIKAGKYIPMKCEQGVKAESKIHEETGHFIYNMISIGVICLAAMAAVLMLLGFRPYIVLSGSMEPALHVGSICMVNTKAEYDDIHVGDIIAYEAGNGALVTHRVITITAQGMETKGDANEVSDGITTTKENFHGKTIGSIPGIGYIVKSVKDIFR